MPEDGDDPVAALGRVDEPAGDLPGLPGVEPHVAIERAIHDRERDLQDVDLATGPAVIGLEGMAHPVPEPGAVSVSKGGVVAEPGAAEVLPGLRNPESEVVVPVADDRPAKDRFQSLLLGREGFRVAVSPVAPVEPDLPPGVGDPPYLALELPDIVGIVLIPRGEGKEVETRPGAVLLFEGHDLTKVAEGEFLRPDLPRVCEGLCKVSVLHGGEGRIPLRESGAVDRIDVMSEADGERLAVGVLGAVALLCEVLRGSGLKRLAVAAHIVREPVVAVPECLVVLLCAGEEVPDLWISLENVVHLHDCIIELFVSSV